MTGEQAVERLRKFVGQGYYGLGAGGKGKDKPSPFEYQATWPYGSRYRADCIAAVLWAYNQPRLDTQFTEYGGWINVDSALMEASRAGEYFVLVAPGEARVGDILMFPSIRASEVEDTTIPGTSRVRIGHTGLISNAGDGSIDSMTVIECSASPPSPGIKEGPARNFYNKENRKRFHWKGKNFMKGKWQTRIVRYLRSGNVST